MNKRYLERLEGTLVRLWPLPYRITPEGFVLGRLDDQWRCRGFTPKGELDLSNIRTGHFIELGPDHVREFLSPDRLVLKSQLTLSGLSVFVVPRN